MPAPVAITDTLESVIEIFFSSVRHRERAAFILCDNLVEMACKMKAQQHNRAFNTRCGFYDVWTAPGVSLPPAGLGQRVHDYHETRNNMQHGNAAATVDTAYCASAISAAAEVILTLWPDVPLFPATATEPAIPPIPTLGPRIISALRVVRMYSAQGDPNHRAIFEKSMTKFSWRGQRSEMVRVSAIQVEPGNRDYWWWTLRYRHPNVEEILNEIGVM